MRLFFCFLICLLGMAFYVNKRTGVVDIVISILKDKFDKSKSS